MRRRSRVAALREAAEGRYGRYERELKEFLYEAAGHAQRGAWSDAANVLTALVSDASAMAGVARELNLLYLIQGEDEADA